MAIKKEFSMDELRKKKLITREEAAFYLGVSHTTMHSIMHSNDFPAFVQISPSRVFVDREIFDQWIESRRKNKAEFTPVKHDAKDHSENQSILLAKLDKTEKMLEALCGHLNVKA